MSSTAQPKRNSMPYRGKRKRRIGEGIHSERHSGSRFDKEAIYTGRTHAQARDDCSIKMDEK
jgi:hypothetical protein